MGEPILKAINVSKSYPGESGAIEVVKNASLTLNTGELVMVIGPSGSGKSSLLYLLSGLKEPSKGQVWVDNQPFGEMTDRRKARLRHECFGFVMQQHLLVSYLNCVENVCITRSKVLKDRAKTLLTDLGLGKHLAKYPRDLSYGERQRVALARGLLHNPRILFADEPTASVNSELANSMTDSIKKYCESGGSCIMVTHDLGLLAKADRVFTMSDGVLTIRSEPNPRSD